MTTLSLTLALSRMAEASSPATITLKFPELDKPHIAWDKPTEVAELEYALPNGFDKNKSYPMALVFNGYPGVANVPYTSGGLGKELLDRGYVLVSMSEFRDPAGTNKTIADKVLDSAIDAEINVKNWTAMLTKFKSIVPNINFDKSLAKGYSNGSHIITAVGTYQSAFFKGFDYIILHEGGTVWTSKNFAETAVEQLPDTRFFVAANKNSYYYSALSIANNLNSEASWASVMEFSDVSGHSGVITEANIANIMAWHDNPPPVVYKPYVVKTQPELPANQKSIIALQSQHLQGNVKYYLEPGSCYPLHGVANIIGDQLHYTPQWGYTGTDYIRLYAQDEFQKTPSIYLTVKINNLTLPINTAPEISLFSPASSFDMLNQQKIAVQFKASDVEDNLSLVKYYIDGVEQSSDDTAPFEFVLNAAQLSLGEHQLFGRAYDSQNAFTQTTALSFNVVLPAPPVPSSNLKTDGVIGQVGRQFKAQSDPTLWNSVFFSHPLYNPIVKMSAVSEKDAEPFALRVRKVTSKGFEWRIEEWDRQDGIHGKEVIAWMAIEKGHHISTEDLHLQAGLESLSTTTSVKLHKKWWTTPVIFSQVMSHAEPFAVTPRVWGVSAYGFMCLLQGSEAKGQWHGNEDLGWIAMIPSDTVSSDGKMGHKVQTTGVAITDQKSTLDLGGHVLSDSTLFCDIQSLKDLDTAVGRAYPFNGNKISTWISEEKTQDGETLHGKEVMGIGLLKLGLIYKKYSTPIE